MTKDMKPVTLSGIVTRFKGNGRRLGYPTANLTIGTGLADGVYFGFADLADRSNHPAVVFIGTPTTIGDTGRRIETHLFDIPDTDYYDQQLSVSIRHFHRPNETFSNIDELTGVMKKDEAAARQWLAEHLNS